MANITDVEPAGSPKTKKARTEDKPPAQALNAALAESTKSNPPKPQEVRRVDYAQLAYKVTKVSLDFKLHERRTVVESILTVEKNEDTTDAKALSNNDVFDGLDLDGDETVVSLMKLSVDGCDTLAPDVDYTLSPGKLFINAETLLKGASNSNGTMIVRSTVEIIPEDNTQLSGLYKDGSGMFCSQCEAQGFRRITYYPDR